MQPSRINNTFFGDPSRLAVLEAVLGEIKRHNLQQLVLESGDALLSGLKELQVRQLSPASMYPVGMHIISLGCHSSAVW